MRVGQDHLAIYLPQRQRVPRGDARRVQGARRSVQRQLPLRRRGAAVPARRRRRRGHRRPQRSSPRRWPRCCRRSAHLERDPAGPRRLRQRAAARRRLVRGRAGRRVRRTPPPSSGPPTISTSSTPAARPACPRACCGATATPSSSASAGRRTATSIADVVDGRRHRQLQALLAPPFMHGAGHWMSFSTWITGGTSSSSRHPERLDPADVWTLVERERRQLPADRRRRVRPTAARRARARRLRPVSRSTVLLSGGAPLSAPAEGASCSPTCRR